MSSKICPNCNAEVPEIANLCKHCFHDFHTVAPKKKTALWTVLRQAFGTANVSAMAFSYVAGQHRMQKISVDRETKSIVFTTTWADRTEAERVLWKDVASVEYIRNTKPRPFQVDVVTTSGERYVYSSSNEPLDYEARSLGEMVGKAVVEKDEFKGPDTVFGKKR